MSDAAPFAHLEICVGPDGAVQLYPSGDPEALAAALRLLVRMFTEQPGAIDCAAQLCAGHGHGRPS